MKQSLVRTLLLVVSLLLLPGVLCSHSHAAAGDVDMSFDAGSGINGTVRNVVLQPDGKVLIGGLFTTVNGLPRRSIARLHADGSGDATFDAGPNLNYVWAIALQPDGKVLVGHETFLTRLHADGSPDAGFHATVGQIVHDNGTSYGAVYAIAVQPDGRILIGGYFPAGSGPNVSTGIARLNADGSLDASFNSGAGYRTVWSLALLPDGKLLVGDSSVQIVPDIPRLVRLHANGSVDSTFVSAVDGHIASLVVQPDGKVLIGGGSFNTVNGTTREGIARLHANGSLDSSFNAGSQFQSVASIALQSNGKVLVGGSYYSTVVGNYRGRIARLHANGSLDSSFDPGTGLSDTPDNSVEDMAVQSNGTVLIGGSFTRFNGTIRNRLARLNSNGSLDGGFNPGTGVDGLVTALLVQPDGKALAGGRFSTVKDFIRPGIARLNPDGGGDASFPALNAARPALSRVDRMAAQADGKMLVIGEFWGTYSPVMARLDADGSRDSGFQPGIGVTGSNFSHTVPTVFELQPDGKVLVAGYSVHYECGEDSCLEYYVPFFQRINSDGSRDAGFTPAIEFTGDFGVTVLALQADGKVLIAGQFSTVQGTSRRGLARLHADGSLDGSFDPGQGLFNLSAIALQADGKLLIARFTDTNGMPQTGIARLHANGSMDHSFIPVVPAFEIFTFVLQPDGKVLIGGNFTTIHGTPRNRIARLHADGSLDHGFNPGTGADGRVRSIALQPDGKVLIGGDFNSVNGVVRPYVARLYGGSGPVSFSAWAAGFGLSGNAAAADADPDLDGLPNSVEYILGGNPAVPAASSSPRPEVSVSGGGMRFTFPRDDAAESPGATLTIESGANLVTWPSVFYIGPDTAGSSPGVSVTENGTGPDTITLTIPQGAAPRLFARLKVVMSP